MTAAAEPYSRCPDCRFIAPPESMDYALTGPPPDGDIEWSQPVHVTCMICHAHHDITAADVLQADAVMACKRCTAPVAYPAGAARVQCTGCGLFLLGQDLDDAQREELRITEGLAGLALRETYLAAKRRAELADVALLNPGKRVFVEARLDPPPPVQHVTATAGSRPRRADQRASELAQRMTRRRALPTGDSQ